MTAALPTVTPIFAAVRRAAVTLRDYQQDLLDRINAAWLEGHQNVCAVAPVGAGKTVLFSRVVSDERAPVCVIAHRQELVSQMSVALARMGVRHNILAPRPVVKLIVQRHLRDVGHSFFDPNSSAGVAGVDTLIARKNQLGAWAQSVALWVIDECHHVLRKNKWGKACELFPNARGLGVTATPERADGHGLGRHARGVFDTLVEGPKLRDLIDQGWLCDYRIVAPPPSLEMRPEDVGASGDYSQKKLAAASQRSQVVGDVVEHYLRLAPGQRGITFTTDLDTSRRIAAEFTASGVPARPVDGGSDDQFRAQSVDMLRSGQLLQLTNVDLFGEGFDLPAVRVASDARPTESFARFVQVIGRILRPEYAEGWPLDTAEQRLAAIAAGPKPVATYIDHVGNTARHAVARYCPRLGRAVIDVCYREWSLSCRERRSRGRGDVTAVTTCRNPRCLLPYEAVKPVCPHCAERPVPADRSGPKQVDGDLVDLDPAVLTQIHREIERVDSAPRFPAGAPSHVQYSIRKKHTERQQAQAELRAMMAWWAGAERALGRCDQERYRRFYRLFGTDAATAQTLGAREARELAAKIAEEMGK